VLSFKVLLLEGWDGQTWKDHMCICAPCHLLHVDGQVDSYLAIVPIVLHHMLCGQFTKATIMLICDWCFKG
jgi:hypothetical protein